MTGKEFKAFAEKISDDAVVRVREGSYGTFVEKFEIQASLECLLPSNKETEHV